MVNNIGIYNCEGLLMKRSVNFYNGPRFGHLVRDDPLGARFGVVNKHVSIIAN